MLNKLKQLKRVGENFFFQAEDGIPDYKVTGVETCGLPIFSVGVPIRLLALNKVEPGPANVSSGAYPLRRPIVMVTKTPPSLLVKAFVDFMLDKEGQKTVLEEDFVPLVVTK